MASASRRSILQVQILLCLEQGPVKTVSALAVAVDAQRPSVSRSLKTLRNDNLVERRRNGWNLTLTGMEEAERCNKELSQVMDRLQRIFDGVASVQLMKATDAMSESLVDGVLAKTMGNTSLAAFASATGVLPKLATLPFSLKLEDVFSQSLAPLADTQRRLSAVTAQSLAIPDLGLVISRNNAMIARAIEDIQAVFSAPNIRVHGFDRVLYPGVLRDIRDIGASYRAYFSETAKIAVAREDLSEMQHLWSRMLIPSSTVANFTHSLCSEVALGPETHGVTRFSTLDREDSQQELGQLLTELNPDLVDKWRGSWQALIDTNPDRLSQAASSYRELIRIVLDELAPDVEVDPSDNRSKRKMQVRQVLDGCERDFAVTLVEGLPKLYGFLSKAVHTSYRNEVAVQAALMAGDGLLLMLLSSRRGNHS